MNNKQVLTVFVSVCITTILILAVTVAAANQHYWQERHPDSPALRTADAR